MDSTSAVVYILVALIGAFATIVGPVVLWLVQKVRRDAREFREENTRQHGETLGVIREIHLMSRETQQDVRELRHDVEVLRDEFEDHVSKPVVVNNTARRVAASSKRRAK